MVAFLLIGLVFLAICIVMLARALTTHRARVADQVADIEVYGFAAEPVVADGLPAEDAGSVASLANRVGELVADRFGRVRETDLRAELMSAGLYRVSPRVLLGYRVIAAIVLPILIIALGSASTFAILLALISVPIGWLGPLVVVRRMARQRLDRIDRALPDLIDLIVVTVEAGLGFSGSLRVAADQFTGPLSDELRLTLQEQAMGLAMSDALMHLLDRANTPAMRSFVRGVVQGESLGVSTGQIMRNLSVDMRRRRRKAAEERAQKAPIKMLFPLVFLIFPSMFIVLLLPAVFSLESALK